MLAHQLGVVAALHLAVQGPVEVGDGLVILYFLDRVAGIQFGVFGDHVHDLHGDFGMSVTLANYHKTGVGLGAPASAWRPI